MVIRLTMITRQNRLMDKRPLYFIAFNKILTQH
jgi:hypothetical protein